MDFFKNDRLELVVELLKKATKGDHIGASYVIGIISIFLGGESKREGNPLVSEKRPTPCTIQHRVRRNGWPLDNDDEHVDFHCHACSCDLEIAYIVSVCLSIRIT
ncbi:hypothetical protein H5410_039564 [Solanum commersonii]|uniref:At2g35280-like TPR domain-containing protein n=1 Tax=Solanum commersonii TaxID=4109 RepID=A0A9J5XMM3_SOLCO|nr:hypothetical protein H5410_039564 [Solanum commersonii]